MRAKTMLIALAMSLSACYSAGHNFDMYQAQALVPGVTTLEQAEAVLGQPNGVHNHDNGDIGVQWTYAEASAFGASGKSVAILFGKDHKMIRLLGASTV